jgi:glutamate/tyrosine decarboxylase-like PLP-dependent enzyme
MAVWAAIRSLGRDGIAGLVDRCCDHASRFARLLDAHDGVRVVNDVVLNQVLVAFDGADDRADRIVARIQEEGTCWLGAATWQGRRVMRISVSGWSTTEHDVDRSVAAILTAVDAEP